MGTPECTNPRATKNAKITKHQNCLIKASQSSNSVNTNPKGGNRPLRIFLAISSKMKKTRKIDFLSKTGISRQEIGFFCQKTGFFCQKLDFLDKILKNKSSEIWTRNWPRKLSDPPLSSIFRADSENRKGR